MSESPAPLPDSAPAVPPTPSAPWRGRRKYLLAVSGQHLNGREIEPLAYRRALTPDMIQHLAHVERVG